MKILVLNSGSSSIKFKLFEEQNVLASGLIERIGSDDAKIEVKNVQTNQEVEKTLAIKDHEAGLKYVNEIFKELNILNDLSELDGCGHRVVHGGKELTKHCLVDDEVISKIDKASAIAPLHNRANICGIETMRKTAPKVPNVTVFDTAFHASIPDYAYMYAIPYKYYEEDNIRRYGFHGTSHSYVSKKASQVLGININNFNCINAHLGNGASVCAIENGKSVDTSMGFTPLEGLIMGTRSGDLDPAIIAFLEQNKNLSPKEIDNILNKQSGVFGICEYNDFRDIETQMKKGDKKAILAMNMYIYRLVKYIGAYLAILPRTDALTFTAGVGENDVGVREKVCEKLSHLGIKIDKELNKIRSKEARIISTNDSKIKVLIVPTDEELEIAQLTIDAIKNK